ncbi:DUF3667 domain-containing protein [Mitsuaria sp. WAJ17]|uniref:DUF3667 domain-containing protein n=1 Tax=Mitsuaria sp. WAJ17 TaxID=2761452 RepID=UPI00160194E7|nr:DUF3667 domain-containing protein [Mitsuaria sp. WAJ17]MBB2484493.1 DUF3667 domain-containing protein [Mitsuaria sp. WAJ17]
MNWFRRQLLVPTPMSGHCTNCGTALPEPRQRFCSHCGQETEVKAPTLGEFIQQFGGAYFSTEGALWRTLWRLFVPGQLTLEYFAGRRRHYVLPLRLYLTMSVVLLLALRLNGQLELPLDEPEAGSAASSPASPGSAAMPKPAKPRGTLIIDEKDRQELTMVDLGAWRAGTHKGQFYCEGFSDKVCKRFERRLTADPATVREYFADLPSRALDHLGQAMFVLLPAFALWLKLLYVDKRRRYTEHLVFALHQHAFWFAVLALLTLKSESVAVFCALAMVVHPLIALHRVYGTRWWSTLPRAFGLMVAYSISLGLVLAAMFIYLFAS